MFVKPATNPKYAPKAGAESPEPDRVQLQVFDPALKNFLPPEGREVGGDHELYWARRINSNEVTVLSTAEGAKSVAAADAARAKALADAAAAKAATDAAAKKSDASSKADGGK